MNLVPGDISGRIGMTTAHDLVLSDIQYSDAGTYTCQASNVNGEAFNRTYVEIAGKYYKKISEDTQERPKRYEKSSGSATITSHSPSQTQRLTKHSRDRERLKEA